MEILQDNENYKDQRTIRLNTTMMNGSCTVRELYLTINSDEVKLVSNDTTDNEPEIFILTTKEADLFIEAYTQYKKDVSERRTAYLEKAHKIALELGIPIEYSEIKGCWYIEGHGSATTPKQLFDILDQDKGHPF